MESPVSKQLEKSLTIAAIRSTPTPTTNRRQQATTWSHASQDPRTLRTKQSSLLRGTRQTQRLANASVDTIDARATNSDAIVHVNIARQTKTSKPLHPPPPPHHHSLFPYNPPPGFLVGYPHVNTSASPPSPTSQDGRRIRRRRGLHLLDTVDLRRRHQRQDRPLPDGDHCRQTRLRNVESSMVDMQSPMGPGSHRSQRRR